MKSIARLMTVAALGLAALVGTTAARAQSPVLSPCIDDDIRQHSCPGLCGETYYTASAGTIFGNNGSYMLCCERYQVYSVGGNPIGCSVGLLRTKESKEVLARLTNWGVRLMVKSCQGHYATYTSPGTIPDPFEKMLSIDLNQSQGGS
jgi:hypothetical protein